MSIKRWFSVRDNPVHWLKPDGETQKEISFNIGAAPLEHIDITDQGKTVEIYMYDNENGSMMRMKREEFIEFLNLLTWHFKDGLEVLQNDADDSTNSLPALGEPC